MNEKSLRQTPLEGTRLFFWGIFGESQGLVTGVWAGLGGAGARQGLGSQNDPSGEKKNGVIREGAESRCHGVRWSETL